MKKYSAIILSFLLLPAFLLSCGEEASPSSSETEPSESTQSIYEEVYQVPENTVFVNEKKCYTITEKGIFVDLSSKNEGGHLGHAMVEYEDGCVLAFYPRCNSDNRGHSGRGWMEYKRSTDYGKTWSRPMILEHSYNVFQQSGGTRSVMCEKAERAKDGTIVLFLLNCDVEENALWEPYFQPEVMLSHDGGETWSEPYALAKQNGRVYDSMVIGDDIYALMQSGGLYYIYKSSDNGNSFTKQGILTGALTGSFYGTMGLLPDGRMIVYTYHPDFEEDLQYFISEDYGKTWSKLSGAGHFAKKLRNPQLVLYNGSYFCFGRAGIDGHIVLYCSEDGINWDEGQYLKLVENGAGAYSNTLVVGTLNENIPNALIFQSSHAYFAHQTNVYMWRFEMEILK